MLTKDLVVLIIQTIWLYRINHDSKVKAHCNIKQYEQAVLYTSTPTCATLIRYINHRAKHPLDFMHIDAFVCLLSWLKFIYSEKATKFCEISTLLLSYVAPFKGKVEISQNFVAFSEYMNFKPTWFGHFYRRMTDHPEE